MVNSTGTPLSAPLSTERRSFQDALRTLDQPIDNDDPRLDFYTVYRREATEYDTDYVKKHDEDLNTPHIRGQLVFTFVIHLTLFLRPVCSPQSAHRFLFQASTRSK